MLNPLKTSFCEKDRHFKNSKWSIFFCTRNTPSFGSVLKNYLQSFLTYVLTVRLSGMWRPLYILNGKLFSRAVQGRNWCIKETTTRSIHQNLRIIISITYTGVNFINMFNKKSSEFQNWLLVSQKSAEEQKSKNRTY